MSSNMSNIPDSYKPLPPDKPTFVAPAHHLNPEQRAAVIQIAESSHDAARQGQTQSTTYSDSAPGFGHTSGVIGDRRAQNDAGSAGGFNGTSSGLRSDLTGKSMGVTGGSTGLSSGGHDGYSTGATSGHSSGLQNVMGGGSSSATHSHTGQSGQYNLDQRDLTANQTNLAGGAASSTPIYDNMHSTHSGTGRAPISGTTSSSYDRPSGNNTGGVGAIAVGTAAAGAGVGTAAGVGGHHGTGMTTGTGHSTAGSGLATAASHSTNSTSGIQNKLSNEIEQRARKAGTHASGFGAQ